MSAPARIALATLALAVAAGPNVSFGQEAWTAQLVQTQQPLSAVRQVGEAVFVNAGAWHRASICGATICLALQTPPSRASAADGIPGGTVAEATTGRGVVRAWYSQPTSRYDHGILGDQVEGGSLVVIDDSGRRLEIVLPPDQVFEDLTPRIADIDGDGRYDVVTIRSGISSGAAIAIYSVATGALQEMASIPAIGRTHRWLNIAGIADFDGNGSLDIALVKTPHIGGTLEIWTMRNGALALLAAAGNFSNHAIGSTELGMSAIGDFDGDGRTDLALPSADRQTLRLVSLRGGSLWQIAAIAMGGPIVSAVAAFCEPDCRALIAGRGDGSLVLVRR